MSDKKIPPRLSFFLLQLSQHLTGEQLEAAYNVAYDNANYNGEDARLTRLHENIATWILRDEKVTSFVIDEEQRVIAQRDQLLREAEELKRKAQATVSLVNPSRIVMLLRDLAYNIEERAKTAQEESEG